MWILSKIKLIYLSLMQASILFNPKVSGMKPIEAPIEYGLSETVEVSVDAEDDEEIYLWVRQPVQEDGKMFVFFHGNTGHLADVGPPDSDEEPYDRDYRIRFLRQVINNGDGFVAVSHRGYGKSSGDSSQEGFDSDIKAVAKFIKSEENHNITIVGESLGAYSALKLAQELISIDVKISSVNLIAPFASIKEVVKVNYPELTKHNLDDYIKYQFDNEYNLSVFPSKEVSINLFHSKEDATTPFLHSEKLLEVGKQQKLAIKLHDISPSGHITWYPKKILGIIDDNLSDKSNN